MWKLLVGFIIFAAIGLFVLKKAGGDVNMGGETHDVTGGHSAAASAPGASAPAAAAADAGASAAVLPASAASQ
jgi:hypothetical protein